MVFVLLYLGCWVLHLEELEDRCAIVCDGYISHLIHQHLQVSAVSDHAAS